MDSMVLLVVATSALTLLTGLYSYPLAQQLQILDSHEPSDSNRFPHCGTPLTGGLMIILPALIVMFYIYANTPSAEFIGIWFACAFFMLIGLLDDSRNLRPTFRLVVTLIIVSVIGIFIPTLTLQSLAFEYPSYLVELGPFAIAFTAVCLLALANAVNMADGKNGIVISMSLIWTALLFFVGPPNLYPLLAFLSLSLTITLYFNIRGRLFLGDSGSLSLGILFGYLAIYSYNSAATHISAESVALWFWIPIIDLVRLVLKRTANGRSPMSGDREHFHHLLYSCLRPKLALLIYLSIIAVPNFIAVIMPETTTMMIIVTTVIYSLLCVISHQNLARRRAIV
ncbi:MAG: undecaprenyl/decaprenyl-phosphate alpha-N-acetylglucosaminyl 1-phosphate transferase [Proteobacteria bacterium]|nr:undecaprenyl/decaprenyl-phosphate alpha-N-acetylglucosaminyl 1-phosphate transferase [Pseudomonadota bacterium]